MTNSSKELDKSFIFQKSIIFIALLTFFYILKELFDLVVIMNIS